MPTPSGFKISRGNVPSAQYYTCAEGDTADEAAETSSPHRLIPKHIRKYVLKFGRASFRRLCRLFRAGSHQCPQNSRRRLTGVVDLCRMAAGTSWKLAEDAYEFIFVKGRPTKICPNRRRRPFSLHRPATPPKPHTRLRNDVRANFKIMFKCFF